MTPGGGGGAASHLVHSRARLVVQDLVPPLLLEAQELGVHGRPRAWIDVSRELVHVRAKLILVQLLELPHPRRAPRHQRERERREEDAKRPRPTPAASRAPTPRDERHRAARLHTGAASTGESVAEGTGEGGARPPDPTVVSSALAPTLDGGMRYMPLRSWVRSPTPRARKKQRSCFKVAGSNQRKIRRGLGFDPQTRAATEKKICPLR